jgi:hypothetical protein
MSDSADEKAADRALRDGLRAPGLSPEALQRIRRATETEWRATLESRAPVRTWRWKLAAAASGILLAGAALIGAIGYDNRAAAGALVATLARSDAPGLELMHILRADQSLPPGADLRVYSRLQARGDALLKLADGGNLRVARGSDFEIPDAHSVQLTRGELYVDIPPEARSGEPFLVRTPAGEFRHLGTQFGVAIVGGQTRLRVREGSVLWHGQAGEQTVNAGTELLMDDRVLARRTIPTAGREWAWAESLAPEIEIENRPLQEFLEWFSRETGRRLELADDGARRQAAGILMHGSVRGLGAMEALAAVMSATTLHYELPEGLIRVSSPRDREPTS